VLSAYSCHCLAWYRSAQNESAATGRRAMHRLAAKASTEADGKQAERDSKM